MSIKSLTPYVGKPCAYCGVTMEKPEDTSTMPDRSRHASRDHAVIVRAAGGKKNRRNIVVCCYRCNYEKADRSIIQWFDVLYAAKDPRVPFVAETLLRLQGLWHSEPSISVSHETRDEACAESVSMPLSPEVGESASSECELT